VNADHVAIGVRGAVVCNSRKLVCRIGMRHQADRIHIFDQRRLVLIDPVATAEPSRVSRR